MERRVEQVERRVEQVIVETERLRIEGSIMLPPEGYRSRLSDYLNEPQREFLIILRATVTPLDGAGDPNQVPVIMVARSRVDLVIPAEA
jgi:hypothetical protein